MPLYEYQCQQCHRRVEKIQKFSDAPLTVCPHCGGVLERTLTAPAIQFKGSGWYKDLYSSPKPPAANAGSGESGSASSEGSQGAAKGEGGTAAPASTGSSTGTASPAAPASPSPSAGKS